MTVAAERPGAFGEGVTGQPHSPRTGSQGFSWKRHVHTHTEKSLSTILPKSFREYCLCRRSPHRKKFTTGIYWIPKIADYYLDLFPLIW